MKATHWFRRYAVLGLVAGSAVTAGACGVSTQQEIEMGAQYVFVSEGVVYSIRNQDLVDLTTWAGQDVQLEGEVRHNVLTVSSVRPLTARRSAYGLFSRTVRVS